MRTIVHVSDLHFGRVDAATTQPLLNQINALRPDLVVVSGDLTQRARTWQFQEAVRFLDALEAPRLVVPGNHDVPAYNLFRRFLSPLGKYRRYVTEDLLPAFVDDEIAVCGLNSTLSFTTKYGELRPADIEAVGARLSALPKELARIVVCHHPFDLPPNHEAKDLIRNAERAMKAFAEYGVDLILSGHLHLSHTSQTGPRYCIPGHSALIVQAGTAISNRYRGELNSFNILRVANEEVTIERFTWNTETGEYAPFRTEKFTRTQEGWTAA